MGADYPTRKFSEKHIPKTAGHKGQPTDSSIEGRGPEKFTIRKEGVNPKKGAGHVGASNVSHA